MTRTKCVRELDRPYRGVNACANHENGTERSLHQSAAEILQHHSRQPYTTSTDPQNRRHAGTGAGGVDSPFGPAHIAASAGPPVGDERIVVSVQGVEYDLPKCTDEALDSASQLADRYGQLLFTPTPTATPAPDLRGLLYRMRDQFSGPRLNSGPSRMLRDVRSPMRGFNATSRNYAPSAVCGI